MIVGKSKSGQKFSIHGFISRGLRTGAILSGIFMIFGIILYNTTGNINFPAGNVTLQWIIEASLKLNPAAVVFLGVLILIATPVVRVLMAVAAYLYERDYLYTIVAITVFLILVTSFLLA